MLVETTVITALNESWGDFALVINNFLGGEDDNMYYLKFGFFCYETANDA